MDETPSIVISEQTATVNVADTDTNLNVIEESVSIVGTATQGPTGPQGSTGATGPQGPAGATTGDLNYVHNQIVVASVWTVTHNLGKRPVVAVVDSGDNVVVGEIHYVNDNSLTISFDAEFSGKAYIN